MGDVPLDIEVLKSMFGDDDELTMSILQEFKNSALPYIEELNEALSSQRTDGVKNLAHKLKSSSRTVGAAPLADICEMLEEEAPRQDWSRIMELDTSLRAELGAVVDFIEAL